MQTRSVAGQLEAPNSTAIPACPVEHAIQVIGGKWKLLLLRSLLLNGPQGYNQLLASVTGISAKELTRNLGELAASGLVTRPPGAPDRNLPYALTPLGEGLMPIFKDLLTWGQTLASSAAAD
jgi:DNA-binding HxlR family transcriptional regulator